MQVFSLDNAAFVAFMRCATVLVGKMMTMTVATAATRFRTGTFATKEDAKMISGGDKEKAKKLLVPDDEVEQVIQYCCQ